MRTEDVGDVPPIGMVCYDPDHIKNRRKIVENRYIFNKIGASGGAAQAAEAKEDKILIFALVYHFAAHFGNSTQ